MDADGHVLPILIFIKVQLLQNALRDTQKKFCLMPGLKLTLYDITSFLPNNPSGLKKNYIQACYSSYITQKKLGFCYLQFFHMLSSKISY